MNATELTTPELTTPKLPDEVEEDETTDADALFDYVAQEIACDPKLLERKVFWQTGLQDLPSPMKETIVLEAAVIEHEIVPVLMAAMTRQQQRDTPCPPKRTDSSSWTDADYERRYEQAFERRVKDYLKQLEYKTFEQRIRTANGSSPISSTSVVQAIRSLLRSGDLSSEQCKEMEVLCLILEDDKTTSDVHDETLNIMIRVLLGIKEPTTGPVVCRHWNSSGFCFFGDSCYFQYSHTAENAPPIAGACATVAKVNPLSEDAAEFVCLKNFSWSDMRSAEVAVTAAAVAETAAAVAETAADEAVTAANEAKIAAEKAEKAAAKAEKAAALALEAAKMAVTVVCKAWAISGRCRLARNCPNACSHTSANANTLE